MSVRAVLCSAVLGSVGVGADRCSFRASVSRCWSVLGSVGVGWCSFRAGVSAVFILNGMIFSFLDEKRVFKGVV